MIQLTLLLQIIKSIQTSIINTNLNLDANDKRIHNHFIFKSYKYDNHLYI